jgi:hypothetical protein
LFADGMVCNGHPTDANTVYGEIQFGEHYKSTNGGANWFSIQNGITAEGPWVTPVAIDENDGNHLYTSASNGAYRTNDGGANWTFIDNVGSKGFSISPADGNIVWSLGQTLARYTTDDGATWQYANPFGFTVTGGTDIVAHPTDANTVFVTFGGYASVSKCARSTDLGATWQDVSGNLPAIPITAFAIDPQNLTHWFVGTDLGVWASTTEGAVWAPYEVGLPNTVIADLEIHDSGRKMRAATHGRGMWEIDISSAPATGVPGATAGAINLMLDPPYPNPFRSVTLLRYAAREPGQEVSLRVFDAQGRLVDDIARHAADGIIRQVRWAPPGGASGVYFAMLRAGSAQASRKLVVVE